jgi:hypothetical protein
MEMALFFTVSFAVNRRNLPGLPFLATHTGKPVE